MFCDMNYRVNPPEEKGVMEGICGRYNILQTSEPPGSAPLKYFNTERRNAWLMTSLFMQISNEVGINVNVSLLEDLLIVKKKHLILRSD